MLRTALWLCALLGLLSACCRQQPKEDTLDILFTGDVLLDRGVRPWIERKGAESLFEGVSAAFREADAVVVNLECPLTTRHTPVGKKFVFRADPSWAEGLRRAGITHAALANNHTIDQGRQGLTDTYHALREAGITPLGYGRTMEEQAAPVVVRKGKVEVALFNAIPLPITGRTRKANRTSAARPSAGWPPSSESIRPHIPAPSSWPSSIGERNSNPIPTCNSATMHDCWWKPEPTP